MDANPVQQREDAVFQLKPELDQVAPPSLMVVSRDATMVGTQRIPGEQRLLHANQALQYVIPAIDPLYEEMVAAMERYSNSPQFRGKIKRIPAKYKGRVPDELMPKTKEQEQAEEIARLKREKEELLKLVDRIEKKVEK